MKLYLTKNFTFLRQGSPPVSDLGTKPLVSERLRLRHFTDGGFLAHISENKVRITLLIWNLARVITGIRLLKIQTLVSIHFFRYMMS